MMNMVTTVGLGVLDTRIVAPGLIWDMYEIWLKRHGYHEESEED